MVQPNEVQKANNFFLPFEEQYEYFVCKVYEMQRILEDEPTQQQVVSCVRTLRKLISEQERYFINWTHDEKCISLCINDLKIVILNMSDGNGTVNMLVETLRKVVECYDDTVFRDRLKSEKALAAERVKRVFEILTVFYGSVYTQVASPLEGAYVSPKDLYTFFKNCADNSEKLAEVIDVENILYIDALSDAEMTALLKSAMALKKVDSKEKMILQICATKIHSVMEGIGITTDEAVNIVFRALLECYLVPDQLIG